MTAIRKTPTSTEEPGGKSGDEMALIYQETIKALWNLNGGMLTNVAGSANAITASVPIATGFDGIPEGFRCSFFPVSANTGPTQITISGYTKDIVRLNGNDLEAGDLLASELADLVMSDTFDALVLNKVYNGVEKISSPVYNASLITVSGAIDTILSTSFTNRRAGSKLFIEGHVQFYDSGGTADDVDGLLIYLYVDAVDSAITPIQCLLTSGDENPTQYFMFEWEPGDAAAHTYAVRVLIASGSATVEIRHAMMKITEYGAAL